MVPILHPYNENVSPKNVCVFVEGQEEAEEALKSGAFTVGGAELITEIAKGRVDVVRLPC